MWLLENKKPTPKTVGRDFILGVVLFFVLLQLIPESTMSLLAMVLAILPTMSAASFASSASPTSEVLENAIETLTSTVAALDEVEVRVGVPRF